MRIVTTLIFLTIFQMNSFGQKVNYSIPTGYEKNVSKSEYKKIVDIAISIISKRYSIDFVKDGAVQLKSGQEMKVFNLHNLLGKCIEEKDASKWKNIIQEHF